MRWIAAAGLLIAMFISGCSTPPVTSSRGRLDIRLVDSLSAPETRYLFQNLTNLQGKAILVGHQDPTAYGVGWKGVPDQSDWKLVTRSHPAVYGWDFASIASGRDTASAGQLKTLVRQAWNAGGVNIFCWHNGNPVTGGSFYDTTPAVKAILKGGSHHDQYRQQLDRIAAWVLQLKSEGGTPIPVIFRPYHEMDGNWFWWGARFCTPEEFKQLWHETATYLRDIREVHQFLYAFSPDCRFNSDEDYLERYPGDDLTDLIGMDNYWDFGPYGAGLEGVRKKLRILSRIAEERGKLAALTETGLEGIPDSTWFTQTLYPQITSESVAISFVMFWRNADKKHHYVPYPGHRASADFIRLMQKPDILNGSEVPRLYQPPGH